jgi:hypothetical protein
MEINVLLQVTKIHTYVLSEVYASIEADLIMRRNLSVAGRKWKERLVEPL